MNRQSSILVIASTLALAAPSFAATDFSGLVKTFAGVVRSFEDLDAKRAQMDSDINKALNAGQLSAADAATLKSELAALEQREAQLKLSGKKFGFTQQLLFTNDVNMLNNRIAQAIASKTNA
ncbi:MAG: hypothetical protein K2X27_08075, partial [Candidatus Obscuribacterales bacterium]|nr:hypothetical protein [Candidatus Obscuribacterales bacterium]